MSKEEKTPGKKKNQFRLSPLLPLVLDLGLEVEMTKKIKEVDGGGPAMNKTNRKRREREKKYQ